MWEEMELDEESPKWMLMKTNKEVERRKQ